MKSFLSFITATPSSTSSKYCDKDTSDAELLLAPEDAEMTKEDPVLVEMKQQLHGKDGNYYGKTTQQRKNVAQPDNMMTSSHLVLPAVTSSSSKRRPQTSRSKILTACALQTFCSCSMVLVNKQLASSYNHFLPRGEETGIIVNLNILLVVFQALVAAISVEICKFFKFVDYPKFEYRTAKLWAPLNLLFCAMLLSGMASLQHNSVPMVTVFKNIANIFITVGDWRYFNTPVEFLVKLSFAIMLIGACLAATHDVAMTFWGMFWMICNCLSTAGYVLYMKFATNTVKLSKFGMVYYNNILCIAILLPVAIAKDELRALLSTPSLYTNRGYILSNIFAGLVGFFLNFSSLHCVSVTGPTTYAILGSLNKVPVSILGYFLFDAPISGQEWFFIAVSMIGGFLYSYAKLDPHSPGKKKKKSIFLAPIQPYEEEHRSENKDNLECVPLVSNEEKSARV